MKRLLAQIGITYFSVLAVAFYLSEKLTFILLLSAVLAGVVLLCVPAVRKTIWIPAVAFAAAVACLLNLGYSLFVVIPIQEKYAGSDRQIEAKLTDEVYQAYSKYYYRLQTDKIDEQTVHTHLLLKTSRPIDAEPFDTIAFTSDISATENRYYLAKGYYISVDTINESFTVTQAQEQPLYAYAIRLRGAMREALEEFLPSDEASLCEAVMVGDKYALSRSDKNSFRYAGASYFVVVSGLHFSVICLALLWLLRRLRLRPWLQVLITFPPVFLYMAVTGFQPSVVRSGVMMSVFLISKLIRRMNDSHNSLAIAGIVASAVFTPYGMGDIGLILSYAATFAIITWADPIEKKLRVSVSLRWYHHMWNGMAAILSISLAANILVFPISVFVFSGFSTVTLLSSLLLYWPIWALLMLSLILCLLFYLGPLYYVSMALAWPLYCLAKLILWLVRTLAGLPFSYVHIGADYVYIWMAATVVLGIIVIAWRNGYRFLPYASLISFILLLVLAMNHAVGCLHTVELNVYSCGEGIAAGLDYHGDLYMLGFSAKSKEAYAVFERLSRSYSKAELAVCMKPSDLKNYTRLVDREFAISRRLLYDKSILADDDPDTMTARTDEIYYIGADAYFVTAVCQNKILVSLLVNGRNILLIPDRFPYDKIPESMRQADIIVIQNVYDGYEQLRCDTLVVSNTAEKARAAAELMQRSANDIIATDTDDISIDLR